jgi:hypothetical protein
MWDKYELVFELTEPMLGTIPKDPKVFESYVMDQAKTDMEKQRAEGDLDKVPEEVESRGWTGFYENEEGHPILMDYQFKGFLKNAGNVLKGALKIPNLRQHVSDTVFVNPRQIELAEKPDDVLERPLRAMTMQGPRVTLVRSDVINSGHQYTLEIQRLQGSKVTVEALKEILAYGELSGLLQWRNGGYGRFKVVSFKKK